MPDTSNQMIHSTNQELFKMGWKWALRDDTGALLAVSICVQDAMDWRGRGNVFLLVDYADMEDW